MMIVNHKIRAGVAVLFLSLLPAYALPQNYNKPDSLNLNLVSVESKPNGAIVQINGLYSFVGRTPFVVPYPLEGRYKIKATLDGYESETSLVDFIGNEKSNILIKLDPKMRLKAGIRSLAFPGWGQFYSGDKIRGAIISATQTALGIGTAFAVHNYNNSKDDLDRAVEIFNRNMDEASFQDVQNKLIEAQKDYDFRKTMVIITTGFWVYNILDSIIFFTDKGSNIEVKKGYSTNTNHQSVMISWKIEL